METTLVHYGVKGMRWGVRRYQNKDGSLTKAGKKRQAVLDSAKSTAQKMLDAARSEHAKAKNMPQPKKLSDSDIAKMRKRDFGNDPVSSADDYARDMGSKDHKDMYRREHNESKDLRVKNTAAKVKFFEDAMRKYGSMKVTDVNKKDLKNAKDFIKAHEFDHLYALSDYGFERTVDYYRRRHGV